MNTELKINRERMVELLNEDLAWEYQAIIAYTVYSQTIKGATYTDIAGEVTDEPHHQHHHCGDPQEMEEAIGDCQSNLEHDPEDEKENGESGNGVHVEQIGFGL